jgi:phosphoribosyl-ATP pyrophosphohydrolase
VYDALHRLETTIQSRRQPIASSPADPPAPPSYTARLFAGGPAKIGAKVTEEAMELVEAAVEEGEPGRQHALYEAADLLYHTMVLLAWRGISLSEVVDELARREGTSGLVEKAQRKGNQGE